MKVINFPRLERAHSVSLEEQLEEAYQNGLSEGMKQAFDKGRAYGKEEAEQKYLKKITAKEEELACELKQTYQAKFEALKLALKKQQKNQKNQFQQAVLMLVEKLSIHTLETELQYNKAYLEKAVKELLPELDSLDSLQELYVSESDIHFWQQFDLSAFEELSLHSDPILTAGQVQFVGKTQLFELNFKNKLEQLIEQLKLDLQYEQERCSATLSA